MNLLDIDILSPIDALFGRAQYGKMHKFTFYVTSSFNGFKVEKLLRQYGVRIWGRQLAGNTRSFLVKESQATWAEYVLCRAGVPLACQLIDPRNAEYPERHDVDSMPEPWTEKGLHATSFIDHLGEFLAKFVG